jgi:hypothetical protein
VSESLEDHPAWAAVRAVQATLGRELMTAYGAHGLDIAWVDTPEGRVPGLVFHVAPASGQTIGEQADGDAAPGAGVPEAIEVATDDGPVLVPVRFEAAPRTTFESDDDS